MLHNDSYIHCRILVLYIAIAKQPALLRGSKLRLTVFGKKDASCPWRTGQRGSKGAGKGETTPFCAVTMT